MVEELTEEIKKAMPLDSIQNEYFEFIERHYGSLYKQMIEKGDNPHKVAVAISNDPERAALINKDVEEFLYILHEFWRQTAEATYIHMQDLKGKLKGYFGGDLFPSHNENLASKCGIYTDTLILPDPFMRSRFLFQRWNEEEKAYYFVKHGLSLLQYKKLACADVNTPIVVILPDMASMESDEKQYFLKLGKADALIHANRIFERDFSSFDALMDFADELDTIEKVIAEVKHPERVLFDTDLGKDLSKQIQTAMNNQEVQLLGTDHPGVIVASLGLGKMSISNELLIKSGQLNAIPIIDAPTSWKYFTWKLEYDAKHIESESEHRNLHITRGLQSLAKNEMEWIGNIPPEALIEMRQQDALDEIREVLSSGVDSLIHANPNNYYRTSDQIFDNIHLAFDSHKRKIEELRQKKLKFAGTDIGSWLVVGSLEITAAATGWPVYGLATVAANQLFDVPKLKDIPQSIRDLAKQSQNLKRSPVGMLFQQHAK